MSGWQWVQDVEAYLSRRFLNYRCDKPSTEVSGLRSHNFCHCTLLAARASRRFLNYICDQTFTEVSQVSGLITFASALCSLLEHQAQGSERQARKA